MNDPYIHGIPWKCQTNGRAEAFNIKINENNAESTLEEVRSVLPNKTTAIQMQEIICLASNTEYTTIKLIKN